jgi:hypothetical protein
MGQTRSLETLVTNHKTATPRKNPKISRQYVSEIQYLDNSMHQKLLVPFPLFIYQSISYGSMSTTVAVSISSKKYWHGVAQ